MSHLKCHKISPLLVTSHNMELWGPYELALQTGNLRYKPWKLTWQCKITIFVQDIHLQINVFFFHCHVGFGGCIIPISGLTCPLLINWLCFKGPTAQGQTTKTLSQQKKNAVFWGSESNKSLTKHSEEKTSFFWWSSHSKQLFMFERFKKINKSCH